MYPFWSGVYNFLWLAGDPVKYWDFGSFHINMVGYQSQVIPAILVGLVFAVIYRFLKKHVPEVISMIVVPFCSLIPAIILASIVIYRPFCKYLCPLGAVYSVFNPISVFRYRTDPDKCVSCGACARACKMNCDPVKNSNDPECIRCGLCKKACPTGAISCGWKERESLSD